MSDDASIDALDAAVIALAQLYQELAGDPAAAATIASIEAPPA